MKTLAALSHLYEASAHSTHTLLLPEMHSVIFFISSLLSKDEEAKHLRLKYYLVSGKL